MKTAETLDDLWHSEFERWLDGCRFGEHAAADSYSEMWGKYLDKVRENAALKTELERLQTWVIADRDEEIARLKTEIEELKMEAGL